MTTDHHSHHHNSKHQNRHAVFWLMMILLVLVVFGHIMVLSTLSSVSAKLTHTQHTIATPHQQTLQIQLLSGTTAKKTTKIDGHHTPSKPDKYTKAEPVKTRPAHRPLASTDNDNTKHKKANANADDLTDNLTHNNEHGNEIAKPTSATAPTTPSKPSPSAELVQGASLATNRIIDNWATLVSQTHDEQSLAELNGKKLMLTAHLDEQGNVLDIQIGKGNPELAESAINAIRQSSPLTEMAGLDNKLTFVINGFMLL